MVVMVHKDLETVQCLLLISVYSLLNSTRAPMWYLSGLSMRMCVDLGLHSEDLTQTSVDGTPISNEEIDEKRRVFWVAYTLDRILSITLGRPLSMRDGTIDVQLPREAGHELKYKQMIHWIKLQRMQSEMVTQLYGVRKRKYGQSGPLSEWLQSMMAKLGNWRDEAMQYADLDSHTSDWWNYWYHNATLLLLRPSLSDSSSDPAALQTCYTSAIAIMQISFIRQSTHTLEMTWIVVHHQFIAGITLLFAIWNCTEVRSKAITEWTTVKSCLIQCGLILEGMTRRWQSAKGAREVLQRLASITIEVLEKETRGTQLSGSASKHPAPSSILAEQSGSASTSNHSVPGMEAAIQGLSTISSTPQATMLTNDSMSFPPMFGEDLARNLHADLAVLYGFDYLSSNLFDDIDWSQTESPLNFHGNNVEWGFEG
jgi:Fungal specific transcription factor domain